MVNLEWYRTFKAIYENGTLTKAANILYTSQPGVSVHLNALEAYVGKKLFERTSRKMIPTEDGKILYEFIQKPIKELEIIEQRFKKTSIEKNKSVHIGMCSEIFQFVIEPEIHHLDFDLEVRFGEHQNLIKDVSSGILDMVVTPKTNDDQDHLIHFQPFSKERIVLIAGIKTETSALENLIKKKNFKTLEKELENQIWYSASNEMEHFRSFWHQNFKHKPSFKPNYILPNISSIIRCLSNDSGLALVPDFLCKEAIENEKIKLLWDGEFKTENILYFATRKNLKQKTELKTLEEVFEKKMKK